MGFRLVKAKLTEADIPNSYIPVLVSLSLMLTTLTIVENLCCDKKRYLPVAISFFPVASFFSLLLKCITPSYQPRCCKAIHSLLRIAGFFKVSEFASCLNMKAQQSSESGLFAHSSLFFWEPLKHNESHLPCIDSQVQLNSSGWWQRTLNGPLLLFRFPREEALCLT